MPAQRYRYNLTARQSAAAKALKDALSEATECGLFDDALPSECNPRYLNMVCDAVDAVADNHDIKDH